MISKEYFIIELVKVSYKYFWFVFISFLLIYYYLFCNLELFEIVNKGILKDYYIVKRFWWIFIVVFVVVYVVVVVIVVLCNIFCLKGI